MRDDQGVAQAGGEVAAEVGLTAADAGGDQEGDGHAAIHVIHVGAPPNYRQAGRQAGKQAGRQAGRHWQAGREVLRAGRVVGWQTGRHQAGSPQHVFCC